MQMRTVTKIATLTGLTALVGCVANLRRFVPHVRGSRRGIGGAYQPGIVQGAHIRQHRIPGQAFYGIDDDGALEIVS